MIDNDIPIDNVSKSVKKLLKAVLLFNYFAKDLLLTVRIIAKQ